jgi:hypothetical protein
VCETLGGGRCAKNFHQFNANMTSFCELYSKVLDRLDHKLLTRVYYHEYHRQETTHEGIAKAKRLAYKVFEAYAAFLALKMMQPDADAQQNLAPSQVVERMWTIHILNSEQYSDDCAFLGFVIDHELDIPDKDNKYIRTYKLLKDLNYPVGEDTEIWPTPREIADTMTEDREGTVSTKPQVNTNTEPRFICVQDSIQDTAIMLKVTSSTKVERILQQLGREGTLYLEGQPLHTQATVGDLGLVDGTFLDIQ